MFLRNNHVSTNNIIDLVIIRFFQTMDLRYNRLSTVDEEVLQKMFGSSKVEYHLAGNPIPCLCNNSAFVVALQHHQHQVLISVHGLTSFRTPTLSGYGPQKHASSRLQQFN